MQPSIEVPLQEPVGLRLPPALEGLRRLAYNLWWTWHPELRDLFGRIDGPAWARYRSPIPVLQGFRDWPQLLESESFMADYQRLLERFDSYMANGAGHWFSRLAGDRLQGPIAYFCAEYGLHESLGTYSGGLGVLAGDHLKTASDMAIPLVAVGLFYRHGYFRQAIDADGRQEHAYPDFDPSWLPLRQVVAPDGSPLQVPVELPGRVVQCAVWCARVGRVPLLLLDTDLPGNADEDRPITHILYVRGREMRLHQEMVLGVGGVRALRALGLAPAAWHLNEGHSALMLVERARELMLSGRSLDEALDAVGRETVFTIHTPVSAGNERFEAGLVRHIAGPLCGEAGIDLDRLLALGLGVDGDPAEFDMTAFSLRLTHGANAVSQLHARTANETWRAVAAQPILAITNGVHTPTWLGSRIRRLYEGRGVDLARIDDEADPQALWDQVVAVPDERLWEAHLHEKRELAYFARRRLLAQFSRHGESPEALAALAHVLDPDILTIGFARRFATYKRAALLFTDEERLARLLWDAQRPVQIVFAGKAHPADRPGQRVIQEIFSRTRSPSLRGRAFVLEDYDMRIARFLVHGVDVWLNNPRRPLEASGTSGMKAAANGIVNCSVLDGWWDEGWDGTNGWAIGGRETDPDEGAQDWADVQELYRLLEEEIAPRYYDRDETGLPRAWIALMRRSISSTIWRFSATRMLEEYVEQLYLPAMAGGRGSAPADLSRAATGGPTG